jgi:hypothetical protein
MAEKGKRGFPKGAARGGISGEQSQAIGKLLDKPLAPEPEVPDTALARLSVLAKHIQTLKKPPEPNPYQRDFHKFLTTLCYTKDEAAGGRVAQMPDYPFFGQLCDALILYSPLLIDKARRVLASWIVCAFDLWLIGGGQDPRWVNEQGEAVLMQSTENRKVVIASQKLEGPAGSAWFLEERIRFIYDQFEERGFRELYWPEFPTIEFKFGKAVASNGGSIECIAQGADQARGLAATLFHCEELSAWDKAGTTIGTIMPTLRGGGHLAAIATARSGTYAHRIIKEELGQRW